MNKINALIIGAGNISAFYDTPSTDNVLSHAHAITKNDNFRLIGFVDTFLEKAQKAAHIWGGKGFSSLTEVKERIDLICVAVPDQYHYSVVRDAVAIRPKVVIIEKPIAIDINEGIQLVEFVTKHNICAEVNYSRRFINGFSYLKEQLPYFGDLLGGSVLYGKGLLHNGSHMVNLLLYLFDTMDVVNSLNSVDDYTQVDKSKEIVYSINGVHVIFQPVDARIVTTFEFDLCFSKGRVKYDGAKAELLFYTIGDSDVYVGERNYVYDRSIKLSASEAMINLYEHIVELLAEKDNVISSVYDAYRTLQLCKV